jgi:parallel beta-helix repeat protein
VAAQNEKIVFTSVNNDNVGGDTNTDGAATVPTRGSWGGIYFRDASNDASCVMRRCDITYGGSGSRGGIVIENANTTIDSCSMANNYFGAEIRGISKPNFMNNVMASSTVVPIAMSFDSEPVFLNNSFSFSDNQYDAIGLLGGTLGANSHLIQRNVTGLPNVTYLMLGALTIPQNYTLTVDTGIVIKSQSYGIIVQGALIANGGAETKQVIFTSVHDDNVGNPSDTNKNGTQTNPAKTDWYGITFEGTSDDTKCLLNYCQIKYAQANQYYSSQYISGAVNAVNSSPTISNCIIKDVKYGLVAFQASNPIVTNTEFINSLYTPIALSVSANPTFTNIKFTNNAYTALGIIGETVGINGTIAKRNVAGYNNISYVLLGEMTINSGTNVTVSPGVVIKMQNNIYVNGGLKAEGLANDSITFTSINDDNFGNPEDTRSDGNATLPAKGNWGTIQFKATTDDAFSTFNYCKLLYGGNILTFTDAGNAIKNTTISDGSGNGLRIEGTSTPNCTEAVVIKNCSLDPISMSLTSNPLFNITSPFFKSLGNGSNGIKILEGNLSSNATLIKRDVGQIYNVAYIIDFLTVMPNTTLTIKDGVVLKFIAPYYPTYKTGIIVNGAFSAIGTNNSPIVLTSIKDDSKGGDTNGDGNSSVPNRNDWSNIRFNSSSLDATNVLRNCILNYGGYNQDIKEYVNISIYDAKVLIDSCRIEQNNNSAIGVYGSASPEIKNNEINNIGSTPIRMSMFSNPSFSNNKLSNIGINAIGVIPETYSSDATIPIRNFAGYTNMTYFLHGTCNINSGTHITIPKGVVFKKESSSCFDVSGYLTVEGTESEPVVFTDVNDDTYGNPLDTKNNGLTVLPSKGTNALTFQDISNDLSSIKYTVFNYFDKGINLLQSSPSIQNSNFQNSNWGIILNGVSTPAVDNNKFSNLTYTPLCLSLVSYPSSSVGNSISGTTYKAIGVLPEELVQDDILEKKDFGGISNIPYYFTGDYTVGTSVTLTIKPGVICKFADNALLNVKRGLLALGGSTPDSTIVFTSIKDDFYGGDTNSDSTATNPKTSFYYPSYSNWLGINFEDVSLDNLCKLDHCILKYAGNFNGNDISAVSMSAASPTISNCMISENPNGILIKGSSNPVISNCDFFNNKKFTVNNVNKAFDVDAKNCWWGDNSGPTYTSNVNGIGGKISDKVLYSPWKTTGSANPIMGDVSLNGSVQAYDASLVLQSVVSLITLNTLQKTVADVSGDGNVTSFDASLILQNVAGINSAFPAEMKSPGVKNEVILSYGNVSKSADQMFTIPVNIENGNRSMALDIATTYDGAVLEPVSVTSGKDIPNNLFVYNIDKTNGKILIGIAGTENLSNQAEVANINFRIVSNTSSNTVTTLGINQFKANETDYTLSAIAKVIQISDLASGINTVSTDRAKLSVYPNPLKSNSKVHFTVEKSGTNVTISLFDITGKQVDVLVNGMQSAGSYSIDLNKMNRGIYLLKMISGNDTQIQKVIVE